MIYIAILLSLLQHYPLLSLLAVLVFAIIVIILKFNITSSLKGVFWILGICIALWFANLFVGQFIVNAIVVRWGTCGEGIVTAQSQTAIIYNDQPVIRLDVIIKPKNTVDKILSTHCLTSDFNIVPKPFDDGYSFPSVGQKFNTRYIPNFPRAFIILSNDSSDYSLEIKASKLNKEISRLESQLKLDTANVVCKQKLANIKDAYLKLIYKSDTFQLRMAQREIDQLRGKVK